MICCLPDAGGHPVFLCSGLPAAIHPVFFGPADLLPIVVAAASAPVADRLSAQIADLCFVAAARFYPAFAGSFRLLTGPASGSAVVTAFAVSGVLPVSFSQIPN